MSTSATQPELRRKILDVTRHLLIKEGYAGLSMRKIARAIGYSATTIYLYFKNKDELFHTLILEGLELLYKQLQEGVDGVEDPEKRLRALCEQYLMFGLRNPEYYEIMFIMHPEKTSRFPVEDFRKGRRNLQLFADTLARGADQGLFQVEDSRVSASVIWAYLHGVVSLLIAQRVDVRINHEQFVEEAIDRAVGSFRAITV